MRVRSLFIIGILAIFILQAYKVPKNIKVLNFDEFEPLLHYENDSIYIVNFWATWCAPCVKELPYFQKIADQNKDKKIKFLLVSLDFPNQLEKRLLPFLEKNNIDLEVLVLDDPNQNAWIDKVHKNWSGAIPATLIYSKNRRELYEKSFSYEELTNIVNSKIENYENN